jgi:hypothetical protein
MKDLIRTTIDPKDFRAKHKTILCRNAAGELTATTEIFYEDYDPATKLFTMQVGIYYPRNSTSGRISLAVIGMKDSRPVALKKPDYILTQKDFDAVMRGEVIEVPNLN